MVEVDHSPGFHSQLACNCEVCQWRMNADALDETEVGHKDAAVVEVAEVVAVAAGEQTEEEQHTEMVAKHAGVGIALRAVFHGAVEEGVDIPVGAGPVERKHSLVLRTDHRSYFVAICGGDVGRHIVWVVVMQHEADFGQTQAGDE